MSQNKKNISIADILTSISGVLIVATYCIGCLLGGEDLTVLLGTSIALALGLVILTLFIIKAKTTTNNFKRWSIVELVSFVAIVAILGFCLKPSTTAINYFLNRQKVKVAAAKNVKFISDQIDSFTFEQSECLENTVRGLRNYLSFNPNVSNVDPQLIRFINRDVLKGHNTRLNGDIINDYYRTSARAIEFGGESDTNYIATFRAELDDINEGIGRWHYTQLSRLAAQTSALTRKVNDRLNNASALFNFPVILINDNNNFSFNSGNKPTYPINTEEVSFRIYYTAATQPATLSATAIYLLLVFLFNLDYLVARRSPFRPASKGKKKSDSLGMTL